MAQYTLKGIMYGDKYGIESAVFTEAFRMAEQGMNSNEIREKLNILYVKHTLLAVKKLYKEDDCIRDNEITIAF